MSMDNVVVQGGEVAVSSMIKAAMPDLHQGSILRSARTALKDFEGPGLAQKMVKGRMTTMASLDVCNYIMDNLPGARWVAWRNAQGESFKTSLAEHVEAEKAPEEVPVEEVEEQEEVQETKESTMKKALRTLDINGSVRIDEASGKASIIDVIRLLSPGVSADGASQMLIRLLSKYRPNSRIVFLKINGKGRRTPCTDFKTLVEIVWVLPASASRDFRRTSAETICRVMGGDIELCREIEENDAKWRAMEGGDVIQQRLLDPVEYTETETFHETPQEFAVRDDLAFFLHGKTEVQTPSGFIDVLTDNEVIEVKYYRNWKGGMGQVLAYGSHYPSRRKRLHLFAHAGDTDMSHHFTLAKSVCTKYGVHVTHKQVVEIDFFENDIVSRKRKVHELF